MPAVNKKNTKHAEEIHVVQLYISLNVAPMNVKVLIASSFHSRYQSGKGVIGRQSEKFRRNVHKSGCEPTVLSLLRHALLLEAI